MAHDRAVVAGERRALRVVERLAAALRAEVQRIQLGGALPRHHVDAARVALQLRVDGARLHRFDLRVTALGQHLATELALLIRLAAGRFCLLDALGTVDLGAVSRPLVGRAPGTRATCRGTAYCGVVTATRERHRGDDEHAHGVSARARDPNPGGTGRRAHDGDWQSRGCHHAP